MVAGFTIRRLQIGKKFHLSISGSAEVIPKTFSCYLPCRLRVVPHLSPRIVERVKRERVWKSPHARKGYTRRDRVSPFSRGVIFTRARISLALLSMRKNGGLLVVCLPCYRVPFVLKNPWRFLKNLDKKGAIIYAYTILAGENAEVYD